MYGCETWVLTKQEEKTLEVWERKILRRIYGGAREENQWRRRTNQEIESIYGEPNITTRIKMQRIRWLGHVERLAEERTAKKIMNWKQDGKKKRGRPKKRWLDEVEKDLEKLGIKNWKTKARNKKEWKEIV